MKKLALFVACCLAGRSHAQDLLRYEPFDYTPVGATIEGNTNPDGETWVGAYNPNSPSVPPGNIKIGSGSLTMPAELGDGIGNSADLDLSNSTISDNVNQSGKALRLPLGTTVTSGSVYYSMALRVDNLTDALANTGGFLVALNNSAGPTTQNPTAGAARLQAHVDPLDPAKYELSILRNRGFSAVGDTTWSGGLTVGETLFIVASIEIVDGTQNDIARLWINPGDLGAETAPPATLTDLPPAETPNGTDINIASVILRQSPAPSVTLDELRVGTTWASVTAAAAPPEEDADFDDDGDADGNDFLIWQRGLTDNEDGVNQTGDANNDTNVDGLDLAIWESNFGAATANAGAVPEPTSLTLVLLAGAALGRVARRRAQAW